MQTTSKVFMVMPVRFGYNPQTAANNAFQKKGYENGAQVNALREFMSYVSLLKANGVSVVIAEDTEYPFTPDSIFPNNWFTTHEDGTLVLYPMFAENRRKERKGDFTDLIHRNFDVKRVVDLSHWESEGLFLEGTGSMILDRDNKIVYACRSPRTSDRVLEDFCKQLGYTSLMFDAVDQNDCQIYHTNVMMCLGIDFTVICLDAIKGEESRKSVIDSLEKTGKKIVGISFEQMNRFAGNMLEVKGTYDRRLLVMSGTARKSLTPAQTREFSSRCRILSPELDFIEANGGGSARCMLAELYGH